MELFDYLHEITVRKTDLDFSNDDISRTYQPYMINRWMSMIDLYIPIVNEMNRGDIPKDAHYRYYWSVIPQRKFPKKKNGQDGTQYFPYIKSPKKELNKTELNCIAHYFELGIREAKMYLRLLSDEQVEEILDVYRTGKSVRGKAQVVEL